MSLPRTRHAALLAVPLLLLPLAACGEDAAAAVTTVSAGSVSTVDDVPAPDEDDVVLTFTGGATNTDGELRLSLAQLESMPTVEATVHEPFLDEDVVFRGVPLEDVLALVDLPDDVDTVHTVAYNEYAVDLPLSVADTPGAILATRADGEEIALEDGGPTRVVFTDEHPAAGDEALWIWSLATVGPA
ncbi:molybdopterin-dependent oxidoreductase [Aquipuribacter sp. SD81]|uniref:molybdopterin-dependent oxidoreductase n=1 Tax=Aquipuribacter sp. SD81 TaxID=3127703 RepID=UPI003016440B